MGLQCESIVRNTSSLNKQAVSRRRIELGCDAPCPGLPVPTAVYRFQSLTSSDHNVTTVESVRIR
jgi:hypothetical protein